MNEVIETPVVTEAQREGDVLTTMRVGDISEGKNPRTYYDPVDQQELEDGIRAAGGVFQPILIRPKDGGHDVVAGFKRRRGQISVYGEDSKIPVLIRVMTDEEADRFGTMENTHRSNMSPSDEAEAAARELVRCNGDRDETARRMGLKRQVLDKRLALMNCSEGVRKALTERKIQLGHAELLAAAPKDKQEKVIEKLLAAPAMPTVAQFKAQLEQISKSLATAIFDKTECAGCHHNSGNQQAMFAEAVSDGHCTNGACFDTKTQGKLEETKKSLEDEYPTVKIVNPGENFTTIKLVAAGATGVGEEQAQACRACKSFGCAISNVPGKIGNVYKDMCFDADCNTKMVGLKLKAEKLASEKPASEKAATNGTKPAAGKAKEQSKAAPKATVTAVQDTQRVVDYRVGIWRTALKKELHADSFKNLSMLIAVMMIKGGSNVSSTKLCSAFETLSGNKPSSTDLGKAAVMVNEASEDIRNKMLAGIVITMVEGIDKSALPVMMKFMEVDLAKHWKLNKDFLELLTKSEIEVIAEEIGLKAALGDKYSKVMGGKKDEIIKSLLAIEGFDYVGKVPAVLIKSAV